MAEQFNHFNDVEPVELEAVINKIADRILIITEEKK